jgi:hypothetical protein
MKLCAKHGLFFAGDKRRQRSAFGKIYNTQSSGKGWSVNLDECWDRTRWEDGVILDPVRSASYKAHKNAKPANIKTWIMSAMDFTKLFVKSKADDFYLTALIAISSMPGLLALMPGRHIFYLYACI